MASHKFARTNAYNLDPATEAVIIGVDTDDTDHELLDPKSNAHKIEEWRIRNIMKNGVIQPITVKKDGDVTIVVAGRKRVRAARIANERLEANGDLPIKVKAVVANGDESQMMELMISENEIRTDDSPMSRAEKAQRMLDRCGDRRRGTPHARISRDVGGAC